MAISGGDGSIILTTKVEDAGLKKGLSKLVADQKKQLQSLTREYAKLITNEKQNTEEAKNLRKQINNLSKDIKNTESTLNSFGNTSNTTFSRVGNALKSLGGYLAVAFSITKIIQFSNEASEFATQTEASVQRLIDIYGSASKSVGDFIDQNARSLGMSRAAAAEFSAVYGNLFSVWADQKTNAELTNRYLNTTAVVASKTGRTMSDVQERIRSGLLGNTEAVEDLGIFVNVKTIEMTEAFKRVADGRSWAQLNAYEQSQVRTLAILEQATNKYGSTVANTTALTRSQYQAAFEDFKNTWGQVVNKILIPVLKVATAVLNVFTRGLQMIAGLVGGTVETTDNFKDQEVSIGGAVDNQEALTDAVKETAKAQEKSLAGFDKINKLTEESASSSGDSSGGVSAGGGGSISLPDMDYDNSFVDQIDRDLALIMGFAGLALVAIGLILLFHGNIAWGIGFIIAGATTVGVTMAAVKDTDIANDVIGILSQIMGAVGGALVAIGIILIMLGSTAVGVGLIVAGAVALIGSVAALVAFDVATIENVLKLITGIAGGAMLALGVMLCIFAGPSPVSIGLIIAGAVSLAASVALNFEAVKKRIQSSFGGIMAIISGALLVIGIILCCTGVALPLGIGLIAAGAVGLATTVALNWNKIKEKTSSVFNSIMNWLKSYGLLILGVLLCFTGIGVGLGVVLIKKGVSNFTESQERKWEAMKERLSKTFGSIMTWLKTYGLLILGVVLCFTGIGVGLGIPLIKKGAKNLAETQPRKWEAMKEKFSSVFGDIMKWIKTYGLLILGIVLCFTGIGVGLGIPLIKKGAKNLAEAQPRKWEAMKDKVSEVFNSILKWLKTYGLLILGVVLCFTGVGVGLGMGLIYKGVENLAESKDSNWDTMYENIKEAWRKIKIYWDDNIAQYFTASWWSGLATNIANGFIGGIEGMINGCINGFEKMINWIIGALNEISFDVPDWVPSIGGKTFGFNLETVDLKNIYIPRLAKGAVIPPNREFLAVLGDQRQGTNIETPLRTMIEAFNVALDRRDNNGNGEQTIIVTLDGEVLFKNTIKKNKNYILATGVNPLGL